MGLKFKMKNKEKALKELKEYLALRKKNGKHRKSLKNFKYCEDCKIYEEIN